MGSNAAEGHGGLDLHTLQNDQGHGELSAITKNWQDVSAGTWQGLKPSEAQLNKPVELKSIPLPTLHQRAEGLAERIGVAGGTGFMVVPNERDQIHGGAATNSIYLSITDATSGITHKETELAKKVFSSLPAAEQAKIENEAHMRNFSVLGTHQPEPKSAPHLEAYEGTVEKAIAPLERESDCRSKQNPGPPAKEVWPATNKRKISSTAISTTRRNLQYSSHNFIHGKCPARVCCSPSC